MRALAVDSSIVIKKSRQRLYYCCLGPQLLDPRDWKTT